MSQDLSGADGAAPPRRRVRGERLREPLTPREREVLGLVCDGYSNFEIARRTGTCVPTVKYHVVNIFGKLGVRRRTQAVAVAVYLGLARPQWLSGGALPFGGHARIGRSVAPLAEAGIS